MHNPTSAAKKPARNLAEVLRHSEELRHAIRLHEIAEINLRERQRELDGPDAEPPLCINCRHYREELETPAGGDRFDACVHPSNGRDLIRGLLIPANCAEQRCETGTCGRYGHLFELVRQTAAGRDA